MVKCLAQRTTARTGQSEDSDLGLCDPQAQAFHQNLSCFLYRSPLILVCLIVLFVLSLSVLSSINSSDEPSEEFFS